MERCACPKSPDTKRITESGCALLKIIAFAKHGAAGIFKPTSPKSLVCPKLEKLWQLERCAAAKGS
jgi:hypothetical protein